MSCADDATLWQHADGTLAEDTRAVLDAHLAECETCRGSLVRIAETRAVLRAAGAVTPAVNWRKADELVMNAATERMARAARWRMPFWSLVTAGVAAAIALMVVWSPWEGPTSPGPAAPVIASPAAELGPVLANVSIEAAAGARIATATGSDEALAIGGQVRRGARIRTDENGSAVVRLPEQSRAWLSARTEARVAQATPEQIQLELQTGAVFVEAAHVARKEFLVDAELAQIRVVGTAFGVERRDTRVVVTVAEGRVLVEPRGGQSRLVDAGQRVVIEADGSYSEEAPLRSEDRDEFARRGVDVAQLEPAIASPPVETPRTNPGRSRGAPASGGLVASARTAGDSEPASPPNPVPEQPVAGGAQPDVDPEQPASEPAVVAAPNPAQPPTADEWETPDFKEPPEAVAARSPGLAERANKNGLPITAEGLFLQRAQESLKSGRCRSYMIGLEDVTEASEDPRARETARILRARCFDEQLKPEDAGNEYRKYLRQYPMGRYADEARRATAE